MNGKVLIAGIGNIFLGDDAFGVEVVNRLRQRTLPEYVRVVDFGIRSYDLAYALMEDWDLVVLVDAISRGGDPGTLYTLEPELPDAVAGKLSMDAHTMNPLTVLRLVKVLGGTPARVLVLGCEPEAVAPNRDGNFALSAAVSAAVAEAVPMIEELVIQTRSQASAG